MGLRFRPHQPGRHRLGTGRRITRRPPTSSQSRPPSRIRRALALANVQLYEDLKQSVARETNARLAAEDGRA